MVNIENMPVFADSEGNFGGPTSDSGKSHDNNEYIENTDEYHFIQW